MKPDPIKASIRIGDLRRKLIKSSVLKIVFGSKKI